MGNITTGMVDGTSEIAITGSAYMELLKDIYFGYYIPHRVICRRKREEGFPFAMPAKTDSNASIYLCRNYTCQQPVFSAKELMLLDKQGQNRK